MTSCVIVVCAYTLDRWDQLVAAVQEANSQRIDGDEALVVIDHNPDLLARAKEAFERLGVTVIENAHKQGLSGGRNTAIEHETGCDVVVYLDDDATPALGWLEALRGHYDDPSVVAVGGVAYPVWPEGEQRPVTLPAADEFRGEYDWVVGCTYTGQPTAPAEVRNLMGCNMSFRREVLVSLGGFDEEMGRVGTVPLGCEETELCIRATQANPGARIVFDPAAIVYHHVSANRLTWNYLWSRCRAEGVSKAFVAQRVTRKAGLSAESAHVATVLPRGVVRELRRGNPRGAFAIVSGLALAGYGYVTGAAALAARARKEGKKNNV